MRATAWTSLVVLVAAFAAMPAPASAQETAGTLHFTNTLLDDFTESPAIGCSMERVYTLSLAQNGTVGKAYTSLSTPGSTCTTHFQWVVPADTTLSGDFVATVPVSCDNQTVYRGGPELPANPVGQAATASVRLLVDGTQFASGSARLDAPTACEGPADVQAFTMNITLDSEQELDAGSTLQADVLVWYLTGSSTDVGDNGHIIVGGADGARLTGVGIPVPGAGGGVEGDADGDGLLDDWEEEHFGDTNATADGDPDGDGRSNLQEQSAGTDPNEADTDGDGLSDGEEADHDTDPNKADSDGDGATDKEEVDAGTDPNDPDDTPETGTGTQTSTSTSSPTGTTTNTGGPGGGGDGGGDEPGLREKLLEDNADYTALAIGGMLLLIVVAAIGLKRWSL